MHHHEIARWLDFVRDVGANADRRVLERHLSLPCASCSARVALLRKIVEAARADSQIPPVPPHLVQLARGLYPLRLPDAVRVTPRTRTKLVYDSFRSKGAGGGVRKPHYLG